MTIRTVPENKFGVISFKRVHIPVKKRVEIVDDGLSSGLVSYWNDDGKSAATWKDMVGTNNGTVYGAGTPPSATPGALGYLFDGVDDYVQASSTGYSLENALTFSAWIKMDTVPVSTVGFGQMGWNKWIYIDSSGFVVFSVGTDNAPFFIIQSSSALNTQVWYNLTGTFNPDNTNMNGKLYINGNLSGSKTVINTPHNTVGQPIRIGTRINNLVSFFDGSIDEVRIYDRALSQGEITALFNSTRGKFGV